MVRIPRRAPQRRDDRFGHRPHVPPFLLDGIETPDGRVAQVILAEPVPAVAAGERAEAKEATADRIEDVLLGTADAGRSGVRLQQLELGRKRVVRPRLVHLLVAAALRVAGPADDLLAEG